MDPQLDPKQTSRLISTLKAGIADMPPKLAAAAKYIIDNPGDFALDPVRVTAQKAGISANTLVRLSGFLGFDSFEALRSPFRAMLITGRELDLGEDWLTQMQAAGTSTASLQARAARNEINIVTRSLRLMTPDRTASIVKTLTGARKCYVTATRASYALAHYFHYVGRMALPTLDLVPRHMGSAIDDLIDLSDEDCLMAITFAPYSAGTIQALRMAAERRAKVVLISDSAVIAPGIHSDHLLAVSSNSIHAFGAYGGAMAVLECLLTHLIEAGGDAARDRIKAYEDLRQDSGAYWSGPRMPRTRG